MDEAGQQKSKLIFHLLSVVETYSRMQICLMKYLAAC